MIDISVIMPVHNGGKYLKEAIDSILCQTFRNFELIIIDDASTDETFTIVRSYHSDPRIRIIHNLERLGNFPSRNRGLNLATGKYIGVMNSNDVAYPQRLDIQYAYLKSHPDVYAVGSQINFSQPKNGMNFPILHEEILLAMLHNNPFYHSSLLIRTDIMKQNGGYNEKYIYHSDYDLMSKLALSGKVENMLETLMRSRSDSTLISRSKKEEQERYTDEIRQKYQISFINHYKTTCQSSPDEWALGIPQIGQIIALYTYANHTHKINYERQADLLLDDLLENRIYFNPSLGLEQSLCCLGCGLIYIIRNNFYEGDEDDVVSELDKRLSLLCINWNEENIHTLYGWIHYLTLRVDAETENMATLINKQNLLQLLDRFGKKTVHNTTLLKDLHKINSLKIFPERTKLLLRPKDVTNISKDRITEILQENITTFVIPVRIDSIERQENLNIVLNQLSKRRLTHIILLEADVSPIYNLDPKYTNVTYHFVKDENPIFHRTKYLNVLLRKADTMIVGIWDTDVIVPNNQIDLSINDIQKGKAVMSLPYDGQFYFCSKEDSIAYRNRPVISYLTEKKHPQYILHSVGGAFFVNKEIYQQAGGENESFYGWGAEDQERVKRMEILELTISRTKGALYHLYHPRNRNSQFYSQTQKYESLKELLKVCSLSKKQLEQYIQTWKMVNQTLL